MRNFVYCFVLLLCSCQNQNKGGISDIITEWMGKEIIFLDSIDYIDNHSICEIQTPDTKFKIINYIDSVGCTPCKLNLSKWNDFIHEVNQISDSLSVLILVSDSRFNVINQISIWDKFTYPIYIDEADSLNKLNHFPSDIRFQTFLLDKDNKVLAIGNPVNNPKVKELYMKIILGDKAPKAKTEIKTQVEVENTLIDLGKFDWKAEKKGIFKLKNTGSHPLVIVDIATSCGCITATFPKEPIAPEKEAEVSVVYKADKPEHFNKTLTVYCNTDSSPITLKVMGTAQ